MTQPSKDEHGTTKAAAGAKAADPRIAKEDKAKTDAAHLLGQKTDAEKLAEALATDTREADTAKVIADRKAAAEARGEKTDDKGFPVARESDPEINPLAPPLVTPLTESQPHTGGFMISEARGHRARHQGVLITGQNLKAGTVVGQITASKKFTTFDPAGVDGSGVAAGILYDDVNATSADKQAAFIVRDAEYNLGEVIWGAGVTTQAHKDAAAASLAVNGLIGRTGL